MSTLPPADWTRRDDLAALVAALGPGNLRWVGGAVRDTLLGASVKDIDAATPLPPDQVVAALAAAGIRSAPTGIAHGTITAILPQGPVEVTTLRRDVATDGRRATVAFATDWREDAARRDFTINALYADPVTGEIFDYFDGLADLSSGIVRFIGTAEDRIREDHLRILRYYRFTARFGAALDPAAEAACGALAPMLKGLSRERVAMELLALLALPDPAPTVARMAADGVLGVVLPEVAADGHAALAALITAEAREGAAPAALRRLAALLPAEPKLADAVAARLRLSTAQRKRLVLLAGRTETKPLHHPAGGPPPRSGEELAARALAYREGVDAARDLLLLAGQAIAPLTGWEPPVFPLKGGQIVAQGVAAGPEVARLLQQVERRWVAEGFPDAGRVQAMLAEEMQDQRNMPHPRSS